MTETEWRTWLQQVPDVNLDGFHDRVCDWAEEHACDLCDEMSG